MTLGTRGKRSPFHGEGAQREACPARPAGWSLGCSAEQLEGPDFDGAWVVEAAPVGVVIVDHAGNIRFVNSALERMFGHGRGDIVGRSVERLLPARYRNSHTDQRSAYWHDPGPRPMGEGRELLGLHADGSEFPIEIGLNPINSPQGPMVLAVVLDVTERKRIAAAFQSVFEAAPYGLIMANAQGHIVLANPRIADLLGYTREELIGKPIEMLLPERHRDSHLMHRAAFRAAPSPRNMGTGRDLTALDKSGVEVPVEIGLTPVRWNDEFMVVAAVTDITARSKMERELRQANQHLEEFTYVASHDLKSPLRGIANLIEWIAEDLGEDQPESVAKNLDRMRDRIGRMERLIEDLLKYARAGRTSTELALTDPQKVIANILEMQPPPDGFDVVVRSEATPFVAARTPIETVLRNLISNAYRHHGGKQGKVTVSAENANSYCLFTVSDDGVGVPEQARERIFRMFQTLTSAERKGSGIGLAVTKRLVEAHGGRIELAPTTEDGGATFRIWWPRFLRKEINDRA